MRACVCAGGASALPRDSTATLCSRPQGRTPPAAGCSGAWGRPPRDRLTESSGVIRDKGLQRSGKGKVKTSSLRG